MNWKIFKPPLVIAHRGDRQGGPENTLAAIESAIRLGVDGVEVDLRATHDGEVVLFHDDDLMRLTGQRGRMEEMTAERVRGIRVGGEKVPTLRDLLNLAGGRILLNLELKNYNPFRSILERNVAKILASFGRLDSILLSSFQPVCLWRMRQKLPQAARGCLFQDKFTLHKLLFPLTRPFSINAPLERAKAQQIESAHAHGRRFFVWTVNGENDMKRMIEQGVDGLMTDEPRILLRLLNR